MTRRHSSTAATTFTALALLVMGMGCEQYPLHDLGYTSGNVSRPEDPRGASVPVAELTSDFEGVWIGEAEDPFALRRNADDAPPSYRFPSGSRRIRLELGPIPPGGVRTATLTFGNGTPPAPATDPDVGYPTDPDFDIEAPGAADPMLPAPVEGFVYSLGVGGVTTLRDLAVLGLDWQEVNEFLEQGRVADGMLRVGYAPNEIYGSWCALQTPDTCSPEGFFVNDDGACFVDTDSVPTDCQKVAQCAARTCYCEADYCTYDLAQASLRLRLSDDGLVGLFENAVFLNERGFQQPLGTVHFVRD